MDILGSAVLMTSDQGTVISEYEYDPFGATIGQDTHSIPHPTNYLLTNQEYDPESDLYYINAKYYPHIAVFFLSIWYIMYVDITHIWH